MKQEQLTASQQVSKLINQWKLNKVLLASKMGMNAYTFKMKIAGNDPKYFFTGEQLDKLKDVLKELASEIGTVAGDHQRYRKTKN